MTRILVVEDERHIASGLRFNLEAEGHVVQVVDNGESALELIASAPGAIDLVVLDVMLPGMDGFAVAAELRGRHWLTPILMLTARGRPEDQLEALVARTMLGDRPGRLEGVVAAQEVERRVGYGLGGTGHGANSGRIL